MTDTATEELRLKETIERLEGLQADAINWNWREPHRGVFYEELSEAFPTLLASLKAVTAERDVLEKRKTIWKEAARKQAVLLGVARAERDAMAEALAPFAAMVENVIRETNDSYDQHVTVQGLDVCGSLHRDVFARAAAALVKP